MYIRWVVLGYPVVSDAVLSGSKSTTVHYAIAEPEQASTFHLCASALQRLLRGVLSVRSYLLLATEILDDWDDHLQLGVGGQDEFAAPSPSYRCGAVAGYGSRQGVLSGTEYWPGSGEWEVR